VAGGWHACAATRSDTPKKRHRERFAGLKIVHDDELLAL